MTDKEEIKEKIERIETEMSSGNFWSDKEKANVGRLRVPDGLAAGKYLLTVTAEDFAYNQSSAEVMIEVYGHR